MKTKHRDDQEPSDFSGGIFRSRAGPGAKLEDLFAILDQKTGLIDVLDHPVRQLHGCRLALEPQDGSGHFDLMRIGWDVLVVVADYAYKDPRLELVPGDGRMQFYFKLSGDLTLAVSRTEPIRLNRPSLLVYSQPSGVDMKEWSAPRAHERSVAITVKPEYLVENFLIMRSDASRALQSLANAKAGQVRYMQCPLTATMFELAANLLDNPYLGVLRLVHMEAVTLELLCAAVQAISSLSSATFEEFGEHDLRCLNAARAILMRQMSPAPTIRKVSKAVGMSETALKNGFKSVFGETVFDFSLRCRMQHALTLLRNKSMSVARIAQTVGYSHQTSFATAFRRHFGLSPGKIRHSKSR